MKGIIFKQKNFTFWEFKIFIYIIVRVLLFLPYAILTRPVKIIEHPSENVIRKNPKPCPDYVIRTTSMYKRKFTPHFTVLFFTLSLFLSHLSQIPNYKTQSKLVFSCSKGPSFQSLINIKWKVSSISLCMQVNCTFFFSSARQQSGLRFPYRIVAIQKIKCGNTQYDFWSSVLCCVCADFVLCILQKLPPLLSM